MQKHGSLNRIYRLVWSQVSHSWVAVAETAKGRGKSKRQGRKLVAAALALTALSWLMPEALAGPAGGHVVSGSATIRQNSRTTTITQSSENTVIDWSSFNVGANQTVNFIQPNAAAIAVNEIFDTNGSTISGNINARGEVFLINPDGFVFGKSAVVNVGALVVSGLAGSGSSSGSTFAGSGNVDNKGTINVSRFAVLLGSSVSNEGTISSAPFGTIILGAGNDATLTLTNNVSLKINKSTLQNLLSNGGLVRADGGDVIMTAGAKNELLASVVNNTGVVEARTVGTHNGAISLLADLGSGIVHVGGTLDASAPDGGDGGMVTTNASSVKVAAGTKVTTLATSGKTGTWLIDPTDFTIAPAGTANSDETGATLSAALGTTSVIIDSNTGAYGNSGNVNVNDTVTWGAATTLTLKAQGNINIAQSISATAAGAGVILEYGLGSPTGSTSSVNYSNGAAINLLSSDTYQTLQGANNFFGDGSASNIYTNYTIITSLGNPGDATSATPPATLQGMAAPANLNGNFVLGKNIKDNSADPVGTWNAGAGFYPIGNANAVTTGGNPAPAFSGIFDGLGHTITNLSVNTPTLNDVGLFGVTTATAQISNVGLLGGRFSGNNQVGSLVGVNGGTINNSYSTTTQVFGLVYIGGLAGSNTGSINNSYSGAYVEDDGTIAQGANSAGGLVGGNLKQANSGGGGIVGTTFSYGSITNSYSTGTIKSNNLNAGGLVGYNQGTIANSYSSAAVSGIQVVGGLVGNNAGTINGSHASGTVQGIFDSTLPSTSDTSIGGLAGSSSGLISNSYADAALVAGGDGTGGLVGNNSGTVSNSHASGSIESTLSPGSGGGLAGINSGTITNSYSDAVISSYFTSTGGLAGTNSGSIADSYFIGEINITAIFEGEQEYYGGLAGTNTSTGSISYSYSAAHNSSTNIPIGGIAGLDQGVVMASFWNSTLLPNGTGTSGSPLTTAQMLSPSSFGGFNFSGTPGAGGNSWVIINSDGTINGNNNNGATFPMLTSEYSTSISNAHQLQLMTLAPSASYSLSNNIDAGNTGRPGLDVWNSSNPSNNAGFVPVGLATPFSGSLNGNNYAIENLTIYMPNNNNVGLFSVTSASSAISNVNLVNFNIAGQNNVGGMAGTNGGTISGSSASGTVTGGSYAPFNGRYYVVVAGNEVGGLTGVNLGTITGSFSTGSVTGNNDVGGLSGNNSGTITGSFSYGQTTNSGQDTGGLVGLNSGLIENSYARLGQVLGGSIIAPIAPNSGGLVGLLATGGRVINSYSNELVEDLFEPDTRTYLESGITQGLVGGAQSGTTISGSFWDIDTSWQSVSAGGGTGLHTAQMQSVATYQAAGWDLTNTWIVFDGSTYPLLRSFMTPLTITVNNDSIVYNGNPFSGGNGYSCNCSIPSNLTYAGSAQAATNAGTYSISVSLAGLSSNQFGNSYNIAPGTLTIQPKTLTVTGLQSTGKVFDGTTNDNLTGTAVITGLVGSDQFSTNNNGTFASINVGNQSVTGNVTLGSGTGNPNNYVITQPTLANATITPDPVLFTESASKTYDGTTNVVGNVFTPVSPLLGYGYNINGTVRYFSPDAATTAGALIFNNGASPGTITINDGNGGHNFSVTVLNQGGFINPAPLSVTYGGLTKVFDDTTGYTVGPAGANGLPVGFSIVSGQLFYNTTTGQDTLGATITYQNKNVLGAGNSTVEASNVVINDGNGGLNYQLIYPVSTTSSTITPDPISLTYGPVSKVYDGNTTVKNALPGGVGLPAGFNYVGGSSLLWANGVQDTLSATAAYASKNALGTGNSTIDLSNLVINDGNGGSNYVVTMPATITNSTITPAPLTMSGIISTNRSYNGTLVDTLSGVPNPVGLINGESLTFSNFVGTLASPNAGKEAVTADIVVSNGSGAGGVTYLASNYAFTEPTLGNATIGKASLTVTESASKVYDGTSNIVGNAFTVTGGQLFDNANTGQDSLAINGTVSYVSPNALGNGNSTLSFTNGSAPGTVSVNDGDGGGNYNVTLKVKGSTIQREAITITSTSDVTKIYDATTAGAATAMLESGALYNGDQLSGGTFTFNNANAGINKTLKVAGVTFNKPGDLSNYVITYAPNTTSEIFPATLYYTATPTRVGLNGVIPKLTGSITGLVGGQTLASQTNGKALWTTTANSTTQGYFPIVGSGLTLRNSNYVLDQNALNQVALCVAENTCPGVVPMALVQLSLIQAASANAAANNANNVLKPLSPGLTVKNGGVKMPADSVALN